MIEATTDPRTRAAFEAAHQARGEMLRWMVSRVRSLFGRKAKPQAVPCMG